MMLDGSCWALMIAVPTIGGNGCGYWHTPNAADATQGAIPAKETQESKTGVVRKIDNSGNSRSLGLARMVQVMPTPTSGDHNRGTTMPDGKRGQSLVGAARGQLWPTPSSSMMTVGDMEQAEFAGNNPERPKYADANKAKWATPQSIDWKNRGNPDDPSIKRRKLIGKSIDLSMEVKGSLNPGWVEWLMNWPIGWTGLKPLSKEFLGDWKFRTQGGTEEIQGGEMRCVWWDEDPSEAPYRPRLNKQRPGKRSDSLPGVPQRRPYEGRHMGEGQGGASDLRNMRNCISAETKPKGGSVRQAGMSEREGQTISRVAVGVKERVNRLKAIGNGQVSQVARTAWEILKP